MIERNLIAFGFKCACVLQTVGLVCLATYGVHAGLVCLATYQNCRVRPFLPRSWGRKTEKSRGRGAKMY